MGRMWSPPWPASRMRLRTTEPAASRSREKVWRSAVHSLRSQSREEQVGELPTDLLRRQRARGPVPGAQMVHGAEEVRDDYVGCDVRAEVAALLALSDDGPEPLVIAPASEAHPL